MQRYQTDSVPRSIVKARITNAKTSLGKYPALTLAYRSVKPVVCSTAEEPSVRSELGLQVFRQGVRFMASPHLSSHTQMRRGLLETPDSSFC